MRTYERTHPWITFGLDTEKFPYNLWTRLGEAASKCEHIAGVPLAPDFAQRMHSLYLTKGAAATTAIEGNTLSEAEVGRVIEGSLKLPPSQQYLADEINNIVEGFNIVTERIAEDGSQAITVDFLKDLNRIVLKGLDVEDHVTPGQIRQTNVVVGSYRCAPWEDCEFLLDKLCETLNTFPIPSDQKGVFYIIKAIFAHLYLVWIHPFGDGNGRTARLLELYILLASGFAQPTGHLLSNHYNRTRSKYYTYLDGARRENSGVIEFVDYSVRGMVDGLKEQIEFIKNQQITVTWINYVHGQFKDSNTQASTRQRDLIIALTGSSEAVSVSDIANVSPKVALSYAGKGPKTIKRDLNRLVDMGLLNRSRGKVQPNVNKILAFLPWRNVSVE